MLICVNPMVMESNNNASINIIPNALAVSGGFPSHNNNIADISNIIGMPIIDIIKKTNLERIYESHILRCRSPRPSAFTI